MMRPAWRWLLTRLTAATFAFEVGCILAFTPAPAYLVGFVTGLTYSFASALLDAAFMEYEL